MVSKKQNSGFVWGLDKKSIPLDPHLTSLCKPFDAKCCYWGQIFLSGSLKLMILSCSPILIWPKLFMGHHTNTHSIYTHTHSHHIIWFQEPVPQIRVDNRKLLCTHTHLSHNLVSRTRPADKSALQKIIFLSSQSKQMLWVLKRTVFWASKTHV